MIAPGGEPGDCVSNGDCQAPEGRQTSAPPRSKVRLGVPLAACPPVLSVPGVPRLACQQIQGWAYTGSVVCARLLPPLKGVR